MSLKGTDVEGTKKVRDQWLAWSDGLLKKRTPRPDEEVEGEPETVQGTSSTELQGPSNAPEAPSDTWASAAPWETKQRTAASKGSANPDTLGRARAEQERQGPEIQEDGDEMPDEVSRHKVVEAESFRLVNERGEPRALLTTNDDQPNLILMDGQQDLRAMLSLGSAGAPTLAFMDSEGKPRVRLAIGSDDSPALDFIDGDGELRFRVTLHEGGRPSITLVDETGEPRASMQQNPDGQHVMGLTDSNGQARAVLGVEQDGSASFALRDEAGENRIHLLSSDGYQAVTLSDGDGDTRIRMMVSPDGKPVLSFSDDRGENRFMAWVSGDGPMLGMLDEDGDAIWKAP